MPSPDARDLTGFRNEFHNSLFGWADALFELCDAVLCAPGPVGSVPSLSLEPVFRRSHGSLYKALALGCVDEEWLRRALVAYRPADWPLVFAVDASTWARCDAETSPERGFHYSASKHSAGQPIVAGWSYQWITQLDWAPDSWTAPLDAVRVKPTMDATTATVEQVRRLVGLLPADGAAGRPRRHGDRFALAEPAAWTTPDAELTTHDKRYGAVTVQAWGGLHPKLHGRGRWAGDDAPPIVRGTVIRVEVEHLPKPTARAVKTLWLWWSGPGAPDLDLCWRAYLRRFDIEHTYRFAKNTLGWVTPAVRTPAQADLWTWLIVAAYTQLRLARRLVDDTRLPWEKPLEPAKLTPARVRRGFRRLGATIGTPASPPKSDTPGPGRPKGTRRPPRTRYPVVKKAA